VKARRVIVASSNAGKLAELTVLLAPLGFDLTPQQQLGIESPPETGSTFLDNALIKARHAAVARGLAAIADDSGIEVDALGSAPGVRSARFAGEGAADEENLRKLLQGNAQRTRRAPRCALSLRHRLRARCGGSRADHRRRSLGGQHCASAARRGWLRL
jgi:XTP/dITP diphosphohydrolase